MHDQEVPPVLQVAGAVLLMTFQGLSRLKFQGLDRGINKEFMDLWSFDPGPKTMY